MARALVVEAWYRGSHAAWADSVATHSRHDVRIISLPGTHWKWRMQGGPVTIARALPASVGELGGLDVVIATGAVDLSALAGLARRQLGAVPLVLYLHENQVTHPLAPGQDRDLTYAMATWRSMLTADHVVFNSRHHRDELFAALPGFLSNFPDHRHRDLVDEVRHRSCVIGVGIDHERFSGPRAVHDPTRILWNHRWEPDKDPLRFVAAMHRLAAAGHDFELVVCGSHLPVARVRADLGSLVDRTIHVGAAHPAAYPVLLRGCDLVVSTARHEHYGIAVAEAVAAGAVPVVPGTLAYRELLPRPLHPELLYEDDTALDRLLADGIGDSRRRERLAGTLRPHAARWSVRDRIDELDALVDGAVTAWSRRGSAATDSG